MGYTKIGGKYCSASNNWDADTIRDLTKEYAMKNCQYSGAHVALFKYVYTEGSWETHYKYYIGSVKLGEFANGNISGKTKENGERISYIDDAFYKIINNDYHSRYEYVIYGYVVPVITLKSNVYISGGSGTVSDPYTLGVS